MAGGCLKYTFLAIKLNKTLAKKPKNHKIA